MTELTQAAGASARPQSVADLIAHETPKLLNCVHCGICLDSCPTYRLSGDENNSPRGRLATWRAISEERIQPSATTDFYLDECVGCLACESICPAKVPYGEILHEVREARVAKGLAVDWRVKAAAALAAHPKLFQLAGLPARIARNTGLNLHKHLPPGNPATLESTAQYAATLVQRHAPPGPRVALFTGCLMESVFRDINFATVRVLVANGFHVVVPERQTCCGAIHEHAGIAGKVDFDARNQSAFDGMGFDLVLSNSAGCGLALSHGIQSTVQDALVFLNQYDGLRLGKATATEHIYLDLPCHLYHGRKMKEPPTKVLAAIGNDWSLAPAADRCCGSGGSYMVTHEENSQTLIREKSAFLNDTSHAHATLATMNHVCLMQWHSAVHTGSITKPVSVKHLVQLLDSAYGLAGVYG